MLTIKSSVINPTSHRICIYKTTQLKNKVCKFPINLINQGELSLSDKLTI